MKRRRPNPYQRVINRFLLGCVVACLMLYVILLIASLLFK